MFGLRPQEMILILLILVLLFGAKKLPDLARGVGRSLRILKAETREMQEDSDASRRDDAIDAKPEPKQESKPAQIEAPKTYEEPVQNPVSDDVDDQIRREA